MRYHHPKSSHLNRNKGSSHANPKLPISNRINRNSSPTNPGIRKPK